MNSVRPAAVAGTFYPSASAELTTQLDAMLAAVPPSQGKRRAKALVVPHAGYVYSGAVAAHAYAPLRGVREIRRVVLLGPAHRVYVQHLALPEANAFATPLGLVPIDEAALELVPWVPRSDVVHQREHSLEVQLPFLQRVLGNTFSLVPFAVGDTSVAQVARVLEALWGGPETLLVISTDLSHFLSYAASRALDGATAQAILALGGDVATPSLTHEQACGATPLNGLLAVARNKRLEPVLLELCNSGDTAGGRDEVVGYASFAFYPPEETEARRAE